MREIASVSLGRWTVSFQSVVRIALHFAKWLPLHLHCRCASAVREPETWSIWLGGEESIAPRPLVKRLTKPPRENAGALAWQPKRGS